MNIQSMLEHGTGFKWKELRYLKPPNPPWFIFIDETYSRGADKLNNIIEHNLILEYYYEKKDKLKEDAIETFLKNENFVFLKNTEWLEEEKLFVTVYELDTFLEKIRKNKEEIQ